MSLAFALLVALLTSPPAGPPEPPSKEPCTYRTYEWDVKLKKGTGHRLVSKTRGELADDERDPDDPRCTVCSEDQWTVRVKGVEPFRVCRHHMPKVKHALETARAAGFRLETVVGYRVGRTRGSVVGNKRTMFSNHSYGTAVDINSRQNGMYRHCRSDKLPSSAADVKRCKLAMGGPWDPDRDPKRTIVRGGALHNAFAPQWRWGGDLPGRLKDFMHFSLTGT